MRRRFTTPLTNAQRDLLAQWYPMAVKVAREWSRRTSVLEYEDLLDCSIDGLVYGIRTFDPSRSRLITHAYNCCHWAIRRKLESLRCKKSRRETRRSMSRRIDFAVVRRSAQARPPGSGDCDRQDRARAVVEELAVLAGLDGRLLDVLRMRMDGLTLEQVGDQFSLCRERVRQIEREAVLGLRRAMLDRAATGERVP